jgi:hypothetical protein
MLAKQPAQRRVADAQFAGHRLKRRRVSTPLHQDAAHPFDQPHLALLVAILYITHRLDEVFAIADRVCVLRDGRVSLDTTTTSVDQATVVTAMVGHAIAAHGERYSFTGATDKPLLAVEALSRPRFTM